MRVEFAGLPEGLSPPEETAERIARLNTAAEREALWLSVPEGWRPMIGHFTVIAIAGRIVEMPDKLDRQNAIAVLPQIWSDRIKAFVQTMWATKDIRAIYRAELDARRAREGQRVAA